MTSMKSQNQVKYEVTNKGLTLKRRKRKPVRFQDLPAVTKKGSFRYITIFHYISSWFGLVDSGIILYGDDFMSLINA